MGALDGTIKTPFGTVQKKTALAVGGAIAALALIVWYRGRQTSGVELPDAQINPATGYPYGSPEDAAALAEQNAFVSPPASGGSSGSGTIPFTGYATNQQWAQAAIDTMLSKNLVEDPTQLSAALGKYVTGAQVNDMDVNLIQQAIAAEGWPPLAGPNGFPPAFNRGPVGSPPIAPVPWPGRPHINQVIPERTSAKVNWNAATNAAKYQVYYSGGGVTSKLAGSTSGLSFNVTGLRSGTRYYFSVRALNSAGKGGTSSLSNIISAVTK